MIDAKPSPQRVEWPECASPGHPRPYIDTLSSEARTERAHIVRMIQYRAHMHAQLADSNRRNSVLARVGIPDTFLSCDAIAGIVEAHVTLAKHYMDMAHAIQYGHLDMLPATLEEWPGISFDDIRVIYCGGSFENDSAKR